MEKTNKTKLILKILLPIFIVAVIAGIWFLRDNDSVEGVTVDNADFALISESLDLEKLKSYGVPIMIDFGADECVPCKEMEPVLIDTNAEYQGVAIVKFYDVWKDATPAQDFPVSVIPTQFFFDANGNPYVPSDPEGMGMLIYEMQDTGEHVYTAHEGGLTQEQIDFIFAEMGVEQ